MMSFRHFATAAVAALCLAATPALAQDKPAKPAATTKPKAPAAKPAQKPAQAAPAAAAPTEAATADVPSLKGSVVPPLSNSQPEWVKLCQTDPQSKTEICLIRRDLRSETGQTIMTAIVMQNTTEKKQILRLVMPVGGLIPNGIALYLDNAAFATGKYIVCSPEGCLVEIQIDDNQLAALRKAKMLAIVFKAPPQDQAAAEAAAQAGKLSQDVQLPLSTEGLATTIDGKPLDPKEIANEQKKLQDQLQQAAEKAREQLNANPAPAQ